MNRDEQVGRIRDRSGPWDILVIGGGATGAGIAVDAASRGLDVVLVDLSDFGKGTSSRSTKLVHGGVRYLEQGNISLVMDALKERGVLRENAPHLVHDLAFIVPSYEWWEAPFYGIGLRLYDLLAGKYGFGPSRNLSRDETLERIPTLKTEGLRGGVIYYDGQFDDARLLINLLQTAFEQGATLVNYCPVVALTRGADGFITGAIARNDEQGEELEIRARAVVNATGPFADQVRRIADPAASPLLAPSQGIHLVLDRSFLPGEDAIMVPHTIDGRVMFAIPWHGHTVVGTTDTPINDVSLEPRPLREEIDFILDTASRYLHRAPGPDDILSAFAGIRPLVRAGEGKNTASLSRDHVIHVDQNGLLTIVGGKWTTYRSMAEDCVNHAVMLGSLEERPCGTRHLKIHGYHQNAEKFGSLAAYGTDAVAIQALMRAHPELGGRLHPDLPYCAAEIVWAARAEMARTLEDALSRRTRALPLNARAATEMAPRAAALMAAELGRDGRWVAGQVESFARLAEGYLPLGT
jgi:glycerol-3-phosphate dehydrogenase